MTIVFTTRKKRIGAILSSSEKKEQVATTFRNRLRRIVLAFLNNSSHKPKVVSFRQGKNLGRPTR